MNNRIIILESIRRSLTALSSESMKNKTRMTRTALGYAIEKMLKPLKEMAMRK